MLNKAEWKVFSNVVKQLNLSARAIETIAMRTSRESREADEQLDAGIYFVNQSFNEVARGINQLVAMQIIKKKKTRKQRA